MIDNPRVERLVERLRDSAVRARPPGAESPRLRLSILGLVATSLFAALFARLWYLQVMNAEEFQLAVENNSIRRVQEEAPRGRILDRDGDVIVDNRIAVVVTVNPHELSEQDDPDAVLLRLATELTRSGVPTKVADLEEQLEDPRFSRFEPVPVAVDVPEELEVYLAERAADFPAVRASRRWVRHYPHGRLAAHVVGYTGRISPEELEERQGGVDNPAGVAKPYLVSSEVGKTGIEAVYEDDLRGRPGTRTIEVDVENRPVRTIEYEPPRRGSDVQLTIDLETQSAAERHLAEQLDFVRGKTNSDGGTKRAPAGSVVVLDPTDGAVVAMASYPDYDPGEFVNGISARRFQEIQGDVEAENPLINRAIQGQYAPGSTFKLVTAYAALDGGMIEGATSYTDGGTYVVEGCTGGAGCEFQNAGGRPHGTVDVPAALTVSSDVYFYWLGDRFWRERERYGNGIQDAARTFGFDASSGIDLPSERAGFIPDADRRRQRHEENPEAFPNGDWFSGDNVNLSIGQGEVTVTPLQLANAYAMFATGGTRFVPRVGARVLAPADDLMVMGPVEREQGPEVATEVRMRSEVWEPIHTGLAGVASDPLGTASDVFSGFDLESFPLVAKTGTAQVGSPSNRKTDTSVFVAYGPDPGARYVVAAVLEESGFGSDAAAPVVRRILEGLSDQPISTPEQLAATEGRD